MLTKQLNVTLPTAEVRRMKKDAIELGITLNDYALLAFKSFLSKPIACRRTVADEVKPKTVGRKLAS